MKLLVLSNNQIYGTIPAWISSYHYLSALFVSSNDLTGSLPPAIGNLTKLRILDISANQLTGTLPSNLKGLRSIIRVFVQKNKFDGRFPDVFSANYTPALEMLDISDNMFTGPLPWQLFTIQALNVFSAVKNCFSTSLSPKMCQATNLTTLGMDGLSAATNCQHLLFKQSKTYLIRYAVTGGIPACLFALPQLQSLHLSGNQIESSLPSDLIIGSQLQELVLSYNVLGGAIPISIQSRPWKLLDLSFNRFRGQLTANFPPIADGSSLYLRLNRLSGVIPSNLLTAERIAILQGNLFQCDYYQPSNGLPVNDVKAASYNCSNSFVQLFYLWLFPTGIVLVIIFVLIMAYTVDAPIARYLRRVGPRLLWWVKAYREAAIVYQNHHPSLQKFDRYCSYLRLSFVASSNYCLLILLPLYLILNSLYGSYTSKYTWSLSACFLSGTKPGMLLLAFTTVFTLLVLYFFHYHSRRYARDCVVSVKKRSQRNWRHGAILALISIINFLTMTFFHVSYVYIANRRGAAVVLVAQFSLGAFKLFWHDLALLWMIRYAKAVVFSKQTPLELLEDEYFMENADIAFQSYIVLFNNVVAPYLVTMGLEQSCFSSLFRRAWSIIVSYTYSACPTNFPLGSFCLLATNNPMEMTSIAYRPPFTYSYQCSSTMITSYCSINVYMFLILGFWIPLAKLLLFPFSVWLRKCQAQGKYLGFVWLVDMFLPSIYKPIDKQQLEERLHLLDKTRFTLRIVSCMSILITFGVSFPPLALVICGTIFSVTYFPLYVMGRALDGAQQADVMSNNDDRDYLTKYLETLELETHGVPKALLDVIWMLVPVACVYHAFLIFDTVGDEIGGKQAISYAIAMIILPCCLAIAMHRIRDSCCGGSTAIEPFPYSISDDGNCGTEEEISANIHLSPPRFEPLDDSFEDNDDNENAIAAVAKSHSNYSSGHNVVHHTLSSNDRPLLLHALSLHDEAAVIAEIQSPQRHLTNDIEAGILAESQQIVSRKQRRAKKKGSVFVADLADLRKRNRRSFEDDLIDQQQQQQQRRRQQTRRSQLDKPISMSEGGRSSNNSHNNPRRSSALGSSRGSGGGGFMDAITNIRRHAKRYSFLMVATSSSESSSRPPQQQLYNNPELLANNINNSNKNSKLLDPIPSGSGSISDSPDHQQSSSPLPIFCPSIEGSSNQSPKLLQVLDEQDYDGELKAKPIFVPLPGQVFSNQPIMLADRLLFFGGAYVESTSSEMILQVNDTDNNERSSSQRPSKVVLSESTKAAFLQSNNLHHDVAEGKNNDRHNSDSKDKNGESIGG